MMPRMSSSRMMRYFSSSTFTSVPPYLEMRTLSPTLTVEGDDLAVVVLLAGAEAMTFASCGFSLAVSGMMMPPGLVLLPRCAATRTRSPSGLMFDC